VAEEDLGAAGGPDDSAGEPWWARPPLIRQISIRNYRSIGQCSVKLAPFTLVVGPNGSGKSNFLDALRFVGDALAYGVDHALRDRGGIRDVRRRSFGPRGHPTTVEIGLHVALSQGVSAEYAFAIGAEPRGGFRIAREACQVRRDGRSTAYAVRDGLLRDASGLPAGLPEPSPSRLWLSSISGVSPFAELHEALSSMAFYDLQPERIRDLQNPDPGERLARDGGNLAAVVQRLSRQDRAVWERILDYLRAMVPGLREVRHATLGPKETLEFIQTDGGGDALRFFAASVSHGTLRALGVLVAAFQTGRPGAEVPLVGVEEPEVAIHPGAAEVLADALLEASRRRQILATTHSPDLLDHEDIEPSQILVAEMRQGRTVVEPLPPRSVELIRKRLYTAGELLRQGALQLPEETHAQTPGDDA
jgi:predicted ATPase